MKVFQFRYYGDGDERNYPPDSTSEGLRMSKKCLASGKFKEGYNLIHSLGIQSSPGLHLSINEGNSIEIGDTGIYELDLTGKGNISSIKFNDLDNFINKGLSKNETFSLLIDIIYELEGKESYKVS